MVDPYAVDAGAIEAAAERIRGGGVVAFPTETVYGLGANALDPVAVARIFEIKQRPRFDPLIVHVAKAGDAERLATAFDVRARSLAKRFWPGPLTLVLRKRGIVPDLVTAGLPTVAVRVPDHPIALALIEKAGVPLAAPSANPFGGVSPTTAQHVRDSLGDHVDMILDGGPCRTGVESTVVSLVAEPTLLRPGGTPVEEIEALIGRLVRGVAGPAIESTGFLSPGQMTSHYAPRTPVQLASRATPVSQGERIGRLCFLRPSTADLAGVEALEVLSEAGDLREAAANLFAALRRLDAAGLDRIVADEFPEQGLGLAIRDRLARAAGSSPPPSKK